LKIRRGWGEFIAIIGVLSETFYEFTPHDFSLLAF
jgi:hypothetical protein